MQFANEAEFEAHVRALIAKVITAEHPEVYALDNKLAVDIVVCRDRPSPAVFFIEVKYYKRSSARLGFGSGAGAGLQPEILAKRPAYFESHLRWVLGSDMHPGSGYWFVTSDTVRKYFAAGKVGEKQNNIREALFLETASIDESQFTKALRDWVLHT
jgi:hypothetical protein